MDATTDTVVSADGTTIGFRRTGVGPPLVVVPGNSRMAHNYDRMAGALGDAVTVCVVERRGRGVSGPQGANYALEREIEDLMAVVNAVGARQLFGHSYGGLIVLAAARSSTEFDRVVVYEPAASLNGSFDLSFRTEFRRLLDRGKHVRAMALFLHATGLIPLPRTPYLVCWVLSCLMVGRPGETRDLMSTTSRELDVVADADHDGSSFASISADTLLIGGTRSPAWIIDVLSPLSRVIPHATRAMLDGADHNAPDESAPLRVANELRRFLSMSNEAGLPEPDN